MSYFVVFIGVERFHNVAGKKHAGPKAIGTARTHRTAATARPAKARFGQNRAPRFAS